MSNNGKFTLGQKQEHGTYNANMMYGPDGGGVCEFYGIPLHTTLEEMESDKRLAKTYKAGLARARMVVAACNVEQAKANLVISHEGGTTFHRISIRPCGADKMLFINVSAYSVGGNAQWPSAKWDKATISLGITGPVTPEEIEGWQAAMNKAVEIAAQLDKDHGLV